MGQVISLLDRRRERDAGPPTGREAKVTFCFDLASPFTYLAAERIERDFGDVRWRPAFEDVLQTPPPDPETVEARARALGLPLVWPDAAPGSSRPAMRVAAFAAECGRARAFVLASSRLAFCGGFSLDHPEVLAEAAAAAGVGLEESLRAAGDPGRDGAMEEEARRLLAQGADRLPAVRVGRLIFAGEERLGEAALAAQQPSRRAV
jgi:2-hydroxychromene-2-carboxylate isomerase